MSKILKRGQHFIYRIISVRPLPSPRKTVPMEIQHKPKLSPPPKKISVYFPIAITIRKFQASLHGVWKVILSLETYLFDL
jgi:hypothetical protein